MEDDDKREGGYGGQPSPRLRLPLKLQPTSRLASRSLN